MSNKATTFGYGGMNQDANKSNFPKGFYFEAKNIRIVATDNQTTGAMTNEKGNSLIYQVPIPTINYSTKEISYTYNKITKVLNYDNQEIAGMSSLDPSQPGTQYIIGHATTRRYVVLFTSDENGFDCIWKIDLESDVYDITLLYMRTMLFSRSQPIQALNNFENKIIDKVYWVDGLHQVRFLNIEHSTDNGDLENLIDVPLSTIDMVGKFDLSQPDIVNIVSGGVHTAGMIQYAYNLYRLNSSQTRLSPLSELVPLDKDLLGGGALNEVVGAIPIVRISDIDEDYTHIKVYSIKYTSFGQTPTISIIEDREIPSSKDIEVFDDGTVIASVTVEEFLFLGSDIIVPRHINSKENRLFLANYEEHNFDINLDVRAYSFTATSYCQVFDNIHVAEPEELNVDGLYGERRIIDPNSFTDLPDDKFDSINLSYDLYKYQADGITYGGEGKYLKYELTQSTEFDPDARYFKDEEIYRLGIEFVNNFGQYSLPKWIADFKTRDGNLEGRFNTFLFELKEDFYNYISNPDNFPTEYDVPIGYRVLLAERTVNDRTIVANGIISPMMINDKSDKDVVYPADLEYVEEKANLIPKLPNILLRNVGPTPIPFDGYSTLNTRPLQFSQNLQQMCLFRRENPNAIANEIQRANTGDDDTAGRFYQYNAMYQLYSPELVFNESVQVNPGLQFRLKGALPNKYNTTWGKAMRENTEVTDEGKLFNGLSLTYPGNLQVITGVPTEINKIGILCHIPVPEANHVTFLSMYRGYGDVTIEDSINPAPTVDRSFIPASTKPIYDIYGSPEVTIVGQGTTNYNNDLKYKYINSFVAMRSDRDSGWDDDEKGKYLRAIISGNSDVTRCITFVLGGSDSEISYLDRPLIESLYADGGFVEENLGLYGELVKSREQIYLGNIYGGNTWEDKKRTKYIEIGDYRDFGVLGPNVINSPGDTFVNYFKFQRVIPKTPVVYSEGVPSWQEIVEFPTETTVDIKNRNDVSTSNWDSKFHYLQSDYQQYNRVYSQQSNLITQRELDFNVKKVNSFDTNIIATKEKSAGEIIDSWTDVLQNEVITLDGKFGAINAFPEFKDELYAIQDKAFAFLSINPRVQVQGNDGIAIELGTGQVLNEYKYISTDSGTLNKWGVISSPKGIYFYDALNTSFNAFTGNITELSDLKGLHTYFVNNVSLKDVKMDNPLLHSGIATGYDFVNNDAFFTFYQTDKPSFTLSFNEFAGSFVSFYDYLPNMYISKGSFFIAVHPDDTKLYRQYAGNYNTFFDDKYKSSITFNANPEPFLDCVFDNINFKSETYLDGVDQPDKTLTHIQAFNDYQDSGLVNLIVGRNNNLRRKFRDWNALIPREGRNRIRAPWIKLKLEFDNASNYRFVLHPVNIFYTV